MSKTIEEITQIVKHAGGFIQEILTEVDKVMVGQSYMIERLILGLLTGGHLLVDGVPGFILP